MYASSYVLVMTAVDRYVSICHPLVNQTLSPKRTHLMILLAWGLSLLFSTPQIFIFSLHDVRPVRLWCVGWVVVWCGDWLVCWVVDRCGDWLVCWVVDRCGDWLVDRCGDWLVCWVVDRCGDWLVYWMDGG